jgi:hypothetical protein
MNDIPPPHQLFDDLCFDEDLATYAGCFVRDLWASRAFPTHKRPSVLCPKDLDSMPGLWKFFAGYPALVDTSAKCFKESLVYWIQAPHVGPIPLHKKFCISSKLMSEWKDNVQHGKCGDACKASKFAGKVIPLACIPFILMKHTALVLDLSPSTPPAVIKASLMSYICTAPPAIIIALCITSFTITLQKQVFGALIPSDPQYRT